MARKKHGDLDRAVDFSQQNDARLIYSDRSAADEKLRFQRQAKRVMSVPKASMRNPNL